MAFLKSLQSISEVYPWHRFSKIFYLTVYDIFVLNNLLPLANYLTKMVALVFHKMPWVCLIRQKTSNINYTFCHKRLDKRHINASLSEACLFIPLMHNSCEF